MAILTFFVGLFVGSAIGFLLAGILAANRGNDE